MFKIITKKKIKLPGGGCPEEELRIHKDADYHLDVECSNCPDFMDGNSEYCEEEMERDLFFRVLRISLLTTGICFRRYTPERCLTIDQIIRFVFALAYLVLTTYMTVALGIALYSPSPKGYQSSDEAIRTRSMVLWLLLTLLSMYTMLYRELHHQNQKILETAFHYRNSFYRSIRKHFVFRLLFVLFPLLWLGRFISLLTGLIVGAGKAKGHRFMKFEIFKAPFGAGFGSFLCVVISLHMFFVLFVNIIFFACMQFPLVYYLDRVHLDLQRMCRLGAKRAIEYYDGYRKLMLNVLKIHRYFQFYRVITMYSCGIIAVFAIIPFPKQSDESGVHSWADYFQLLVDLGMVVLVAIITVYPPATINERLRIIKTILYYNQQMWVPYDQEMYGIAKLYSEMPLLIRAEITVTGYEYIFYPSLIGIAGVVALLLVLLGLVEPLVLLDALPLPIG